MQCIKVTQCTYQHSHVLQHSSHPTSFDVVFGEIEWIGGNTLGRYLCVPETTSLSVRISIRGRAVWSSQFGSPSLITLALSLTRDHQGPLK